MNSKKLNLNLLQALDALLTECNVSQAAKKCFITQSAMSNALNQLRELFNDELLIRGPKGMTPTAKALLLQPKLHQLINEMKTLIQEEPVFDPKNSTRIFKIGMSDIAEFLLLPIILKKLRKIAPNIQLHIHHVNHILSHEPFTHGDIELATGCFVEKSNQLIQTPCLGLRGMVIADKHHPLMQSQLSTRDYIQAKHLRVQYAAGLGHTSTDSILTGMCKKRDVIASLPHIMPLLFLLQNTDLIATAPNIIPNQTLKKLGLKSQPLPFKTPPKPTFTVWAKVYDTDPGLIWLRSLINKAIETVQINACN